MWELYDVTLKVIVSFKFYVMNFVDFVFDFYSHITSHVSQAFASCTHYKSYSLLNFVHVVVCVFCIYLHVSCIKSCDLGKISNLKILVVFIDSTCFSWNWSMGFCSKPIYNCSCWFNLINLLCCEKLKFLGLEYTRIGDFVQIGFN